MKYLVPAALAAMFSVAMPANAADLDRELGLIVSGVVEQWTAVQIIANDPAPLDDDEDTIFASGGSGRLSLPLGENLSIQSDVKYEYNSYAFEHAEDNDTVAPRYLFQGATHLSWRDPENGLFGIFGGVGATDASSEVFNEVRHDLLFVGGEAQLYLDNVTLYGQGGYVEFDSRPRDQFNALSDGFFARGVVRWFPTPDSRLQIEGTYVTAEYSDSATFDDMEAFSVGARYDFTLAGLPVIGDTPVFIGYRGTFRDTCYPLVVGDSGGELDDHVIMVGTSYSFSGNLITIDRQGATLDTPDFNHSCLGFDF